MDKPLGGEKRHVDNPFVVDGEVFVLDRDANPHPVMRDQAIQARRIARITPQDSPMFLPLYMYWQGGLDHMAAATGLPPEQINAWLDHHDPLPDPSAFLAVTKDHAVANVELRARPRRLGGPKDRAQ